MAKVLEIITGRKYRQIVIGTALFSIILFCAILAPFVATQDPSGYDVPNRLQAPSYEHFFGTDSFGRDVFSRIIYGARLTLIISISVSVLCGIIGIYLGLIAGYFDRMEAIIMRIMDALMAFPSLLLALFIVAALGPGVLNIVTALTLSSIPRVVRMVRGVVLTVKELDHVESAEASGARHIRIILKHILPMCVSPIIVILTVIMANTALAEATLTFLGVGLSPEAASWGNIISEGRIYISSAPWLTIIPGFAILLTVISVNILGDGVRDLLDPRLRNL